MKYFKLIVLFFLIALTICADSPSSQKGEIGRFQLVPATIKNGIVNEQTIFKIDTTTGQAWWFITIGNANTNSGAWVPVFETTAEASKELEEIDELMKKGGKK